MKAINGIMGKSAVALAMRIIGACAGFAMTMAISRCLEQQEAGRLFLGLALVNFLAAISCFGLDTGVVRYAGMYSAEKNWGAVNTAVSLSLKVTGIGSVIVGGAFFVFADELCMGVFNDVGLSPVLRNIVLAVPLLAACTIFASGLMGIGRVAASVFLTLIGAQVCVGVGVVFLSNAADTAIFYFFSVLVMLIFAALMWKRFVPSVNGSLDEIKSILKTCMPLWGVTFMANLLQWGGVFVAGAMLPPSEVAIMATANRVTLTVSFFLVAANMVVAPRFAALYRQGALTQLRLLSRQSLRLVLLASVPVFVVLLIWPDYVMGIFGAEFVNGSSILRILLVGQLVNSLTGSVGQLLTMSGHEKDVRNIAFLSTPLVLGLAVILTAQFGLDGTAAAFSFGLICQNLACAYAVRRRLGFWTMKIW